MGIIEKERKYANGKIVVCNFKNLDLHNFVNSGSTTLIDKEKQIALVATDGRLFVNSKDPDKQTVIDIFELLMNHSIYDLEQYAKKIRKELGATQYIYDPKFSHTEKFRSLVANVCIPIEINRRTVEKRYYSGK